MKDFLTRLTMIINKNIVKPKHYCKNCRYKEKDITQFPCCYCEPNTHDLWDAATDWKE